MARQLDEWWGYGEAHALTWSNWTEGDACPACHDTGTIEITFGGVVIEKTECAWCRHG